ncbi:transcriptional adapter 2-alpha [Exaiptasia diaphana]|uniref:Transcriptional adapter n=1 Tax=Exaiptasia diaphana TaxID=2652724 RepID=A0A913X6K7_EXADI|nr:transcriptional adapter 2-alpha [Exaiptasia diaphana]
MSLELLNSVAHTVQDISGEHEDYPECYICYGRLKEPFIRCSECHPFVQLCLACFCEGGEAGRHKNNHSYEILNNSFCILEENWTAQEEMQLLDAVGDCGIGNWAEVSKQMQTKTNKECERHYIKCYIQDAKQNGLPVLRCQTEPFYRSRLLCPLPFQATEDPPRPPMDSFKSVELAGYMPCRGDFEVEYDNYAEFDIKDITLDPTDSLLLQELKLAAVQVFINRLKQRWYRKKIVQRYGLINIKKWQMLERRQDKAERDLRDSLRPFARLQSSDEHEKLVQGMQLENYLKREILSLQEYRMAGIKTKKGAAVFEKLKKKHEEDLGKRKLVDDVLIHIRDQKVCQAWLQRQALLECGKSLAPIPLPSLGRRPAARLDLNGTPGVELLSLEEREVGSFFLGLGDLRPNSELAILSAALKDERAECQDAEGDVWFEDCVEKMCI